MAKNLDPHSESAFAKAEANMKIDKIGNGSFAFDMHGPSPSSHLRSGRVQSPAQHASVKKAAAASVAKRRARTGSFGR